MWDRVLLALAVAHQLLYKDLYPQSTQRDVFRDLAQVGLGLKGNLHSSLPVLRALDKHLSF